MTVVRRSAFTPFTAQQMFELVNDVEAYPDFLPWCEDAVVLVREADALQARLTVNRGRFRYSFTTTNRMRPGRSIELSLVDGPFRKLAGGWRFEDVDEGCMVDLALEFEFTNRVLATALNAAFKPIADSLVDAFKRQAYVAYAS